MNHTRVIRRHVCAICGKRLQPDLLVYSRFTRLRYCHDIDACNQRAAKKGRRAR